MTPTGSPKSEIDYHIENIDFDLAQAEMLTNWIKKTIVAEGQILDSLNFIFCSDEYLHKINVDYLNHDTFTDVIIGIAFEVDFQTTGIPNTQSLSCNTFQVKPDG